MSDRSDPNRRLQLERFQNKRLERCIKTHPTNSKPSPTSPAPLASMSSNESCICGDSAKILKKLGKLALYVNSFNNSKNDSNCKSRPPTASPQDIKEMHRFLYNSNSSGTQNQRNKGEVTAQQDDYKPKTLEEEYIFKELLFVAVLTEQRYLPTRAKSLYETWGKEVDQLVFFVGEDCNISAELSYLPIVKLAGIHDHVYPPLKKTFAVMNYMYQHYIHHFNWFVRADDDMYLRVDKLKAVLSHIYPHNNVYLGRPGTGRKEDLERLLLLPHEKYCMGGPGIILSTGALSNLGPHLSNCLEAGKSLLYLLLN